VTEHRADFVESPSLLEMNYALIPVSTRAMCVVWQDGSVIGIPPVNLFSICSTCIMQWTRSFYRPGHTNARHVDDFWEQCTADRNGVCTPSPTPSPTPSRTPTPPPASPGASTPTPPPASPHASPPASSPASPPASPSRSDLEDRSDNNSDNNNNNENNDNDDNHVVVVIDDDDEEGQEEQEEQEEEQEEQEEEEQEEFCPSYGGPHQPGWVTCLLWRRCFRTNRGMQLHRGRMHPGAGSLPYGDKVVAFCVAFGRVAFVV
jgi:hypothetical protein